MLNQIMLVGRLARDLEVKTLNGKEVANITLAISRSQKNDEGVYETDFIDCILWDEIAKKTGEYCKKGDLAGIKGRLQKSSEDEQVIVVAEKITFLSSKKEVENE